MYVFMGKVAGKTNEAAQIRIAKIGWTDEGTNKKLKKEISRVPYFIYTRSF